MKGSVKNTMKDDKNIDVSVVIVFYQDIEALFDTLISVQNQKSKYNFEVIVVDNSKANDFGVKIKKRFKKVKYITSKKNIGYGAGNNLGAKKAKGKYLFILNPDTLLKSGVVDKLVNFLEKNKKAAVVAPNLIDESGKIFNQLGTRELKPIAGIFALSFINKLFPGNPISRKYWVDDIPKNKIRKLFSVPGSAFMIRTDVFKRIGGFDEHMFLFFEESDLGMRMKKLGYESWIIPEAEVVHKWLSQKRKSGKLKKILQESRFYYFRKHFGLVSALTVEQFARMNKKTLLIAGILALSAFTLFYKIEEYLRLFSDGGWYYLEAKRVLTKNYLPLVGVPSSVPVLRQGALWTYVLALALWLGKGNPVAGGYLVSILGLVSIFLLLMVVKRYFNLKIAIIASVLAASSPLIISNLRLPYHTSLIFLFTILMFWQYKRTVKTRNKINFFFSGFVFALLFQNELAAYVILPVIVISYIIETKRIKISEIIYSGAGYFWGILPFVLSDLKEGVFIQTIGFPVWFIIKIYEAALGSNYNNATKFYPFQYIDFFRQLVAPNISFLALTIIISSIFFTGYLFFVKKDKKLYLPFLWLVIGFLGFIARGSFSEAYKPLIFLPIIVILATFINILMKKYFFLSLLLLSIIVLSNISYLLNNDFYTNLPGQKYDSQLKVSEFIVDDANGKPYKLVYLGPGYQFASGGNQFIYLLWWLGNEPSVESDLEYTLFSDAFEDKYEGEEYVDLGYYNVLRSQKE